jgi:hypothetical protein
MNEEEDVLRGMALAPPSEALDRRIGQLLKETHVRRRNPFSRRVLLWQCAVACAVCAAIAFVAGALVRGQEAGTRAVSETRWIVQIQERPFDVFDWTRYPKDAAPRSAAKATHAIIESSEKTSAGQGPRPAVSNEPRNAT